MQRQCPFDPSATLLPHFRLHIKRRSSSAARSTRAHQSSIPYSGLSGTNSTAKTLLAHQIKARLLNPERRSSACPRQRTHHNAGLSISSYSIARCPFTITIPRQTIFQTRDLNVAQYDNSSKVSKTSTIVPFAEKYVPNTRKCLLRTFSKGRTSVGRSIGLKENNTVSIHLEAKKLPEQHHFDVKPVGREQIRRTLLGKAQINFKLRKRKRNRGFTMQAENLKEIIQIAGMEQKVPDKSAKRVVIVLPSENRTLVDI